MKWYQVGEWNIQLRLPVGILSDSFLCAAYVKHDPKHEKRQLADIQEMINDYQRLYLTGFN